MWELDFEENWVPKNWCFWTVVLEKTLESLLECKEIQPVHSEGDQPWVFFGRSDAKAETQVLWPSHVKSWLIGKDSDAGRDWGQEEKGTTRGWDGWMASRTWWMWVWVNSGRWWWTGRPGVLRFMGSQRVGHDSVTELNWTEFLSYSFHLLFRLSSYSSILSIFFVRALNILTKIVLNSQSYNSHIPAIPESSLHSCFESSNCFCHLLCFAIFFSKLDRKRWFWMFPLP